MKAVVVDASVGVKWLSLFAKEEFVADAKTLLNRRTAGEISLLVPELFWLEISSVLCKAIRRKDCVPSEGAEALVDLQRLPLRTMAYTNLVNAAQDIAVQYGRSIYDSIYVALALATKSDFVTADEKLANAVATHLPVKWLGAI